VGLIWEVATYERQLHLNTPLDIGRVDDETRGDVVEL
jgi:hypothetical protein